MRPLVRKVKVHVVHKITRNIKDNKKKSENSHKKKDKLVRKSERLLEEVQVIKNLKPDLIAKYALGNTKTLNEVCGVPNSPAEIRALARLSENKLLQESVNKFRSEHEDWKSLAAFLLSRNSGRRFKKNKTDKVEKMITNVRAGEVLVKSFLERKFDGNCASLKDQQIGSIVRNMTRKDVKEKDHDDSDESDNSSDRFTRVKAMKRIDKSSGKHDDSDDNDDEEEEEKEEEEEVDGSDVSKEEEDDESSEEEVLSSRLGHQQDDYDSNADDEESEGSNSDIRLSKKSSKMSSKKKEDCGEVVVKKLNLDSLTDDTCISESNTRDTETVPSFLVDESAEKVKSKSSKKKKDAFFVTSDVSDDSDDEKDDKNDENEDKGDSEEEEEFRQLGRGMRAFHSTFMGSLSEKKWRKTAEGRRRKEQSDEHFNKRKDFTSGKERRFDHTDKRKDFSSNRTSGFRIGDARHSFNKGDQGQDKRFTKNPMSQKADNPDSRSKDKRSEVLPKGQQKNAEKLHPSWQASKKRKEQAQIQAFQGKKIKFDDD